MAEDDLTFERVTKVYREESGRRTPTKLEVDFYAKVHRFVASLEARAAAETARDPNSASALMAQDELRKVKKKREQIFQYRERKIALLASSKASGADAPTDGLTREEIAMFEALVQAMREARTAAFGAPTAPRTDVSARPLATTTRVAPVVPPPAEPTFERLVVPAKPPAKPEARDVVIVHVLEDIPPFAGLDVSYHLRKEDIATLPRGIAKVLIDRGKARLVQVPAGA